MAQLEDCPKCGSDDVRVQIKNGRWRVKCLDCGACTEWRTDSAAAYEDWAEGEIVADPAAQMAAAGARSLFD